MDALLPTLSATAFEAIAAIVSASLYLIVGVAAFARAPNDVRTRVFLATALASAAPYSVTALIWARGSAAASATPMAIGVSLPVVIAVGLSLMFGSLTLFHFTQVFPWRRPWIRAHARWLYAGYLAVAIVGVTIAIAAGSAAWRMSGAFGDLEASGSGGLGAVSAGVSEAVLVIILVALPVLFGLGVAVPFAALWSLYKTWLAAKSAGVESARIATYWILISQMAGGVLTILIIPLLRFVAPTGPWVTIAAVLLFAFGLLMPIAFAAGVWKYRVLDLDPASGPTGL